MTGTTYPKGHKFRELSCAWRVESDLIGEVIFPFGNGFGCGAYRKTNQGDKISLQTQHKVGQQLSGKLSMPGVELGTGTTSELSESVVYELTATEEWGYTSRPCEFCTPTIHFLSARITVLSKLPYHLPLFISKKNIFDPGAIQEIRNNCRHAPEKCGNCDDSKASPGTGGIASTSNVLGTAVIDRVALADRLPTKHSTKEILIGIISQPNASKAAQQLYLVGLDNCFEAVVPQREGYQLYSIDDVDRALGAVRLYEGDNRLLFIGNQVPQFPLVTVGIIRQSEEEIKHPVKITAEVAHYGYRLFEVIIPSAKLKIEDGQDLRLQLQTGDAKQEWPLIVLKAKHEKK